LPRSALDKSELFGSRIINSSSPEFAPPKFTKEENIEGECNVASLSPTEDIAPFTQKETKEMTKVQNGEEADAHAQHT
jgi:hypothetical protein